MMLRTSALLLLASGCAASARPGLAPATPDRRLAIVHVSDLESELLPAGGEGGIARFAAVIEALRRNADAPVVTVAAGDTFMPAPALQVEIDGRNAVDLANGRLGLQASALGNHEFDRGEDFLAERVRAAGFPYLTATVEFEGGALDAIDVENAQIAGRTPWLADHPGRVLPRGLLCAGGDLVREAGTTRCTGLTVGVIGATTAELRSIASTAVTVGLPEDDAALRGRVQEQADALAAEGVDVVVLLSHLQDVRAELALVEQGLTGVDVIVSGGGDDRLADEDDRLLPGDVPHALCADEANCYPLLRTAADGKPVAIVATDGQLRYVGSLELSFDERGAIAAIAPGSRPWPVDDATLAALGAVPDAAGRAIEARLEAELAGSRAPIAPVAPYLNGEREAVRNRETNLGNLSADSMAWAARQKGAAVAFALRNGGGIRASIGRLDDSGERAGGPVARLDVREALRFDNEIVVVTTTRRRLVETLEASLRGAGTGRGHFPQVSGELRLDYDPAAPEQVQRAEGGEVVGVAARGERVRALAVGGTPFVRDGEILDPDAPVTFATLTYLARGADGWFPGAAASLEILPIGVTEQEALAGFLAEQVAGGTWRDGAAYADPLPGEPATFQRLRPVNSAGAARNW